jgi:hypothetical protein
MRLKVQSLQLKSVFSFKLGRVFLQVETVFRFTWKSCITFWITHRWKLSTTALRFSDLYLFFPVVLRTSFGWALPSFLIFFMVHSETLQYFATLSVALLIGISKFLFWASVLQHSIMWLISSRSLLRVVAPHLWTSFLVNISQVPHGVFKNVGDLNLQFFMKKCTHFNINTAVIISQVKYKKYMDI